MENHIINIDPLESKEYFIFQNTTRTKILYVIVVVLILITIALLPVIHIDLSVQGRGIIRPVTEKTEIRAIQPEIVTSVCIEEGIRINRGDTLLILRQDILQRKVIFIRGELNRIQQFIDDLNVLVGQSKKPLMTFIYKGQFSTYKKKVEELDNRIEKTRMEVKRNKILLDDKFISEKEYSDLNFNLQQLQKERAILISERLAQWNADLIRYAREKDTYLKQIEELEKQRQFYVITAPVTGTVEEFSGIYIGSSLQAGQTIAIISPDSEKIAEVYVSAGEIGYLEEGQKTKIQVDAFNYNQWGTINAEIIDISDDFILADNVPVFNVKCRLEKNYLELKNGVKGNIRKGMTINAKFMVIKTSLFQLLYQKTDDWLNPSRSLVTQ